MGLLKPFAGVPPSRYNFPIGAPIEGGEMKIILAGLLLTATFSAQAGSVDGSRVTLHRCFPA